MVNTPMVGNTPAYNYGGESVYSQAMTPYGAGAFSPGPGFSSPAYG